MSGISLTDIETYGKNGYDMYRVPGMVVLSNDDVLLYYEARAAASDQRRLLLRRSCNRGKSFGEPSALKKEKDGVMVHNPLMISGTGKEVYFFWNEDYKRLYFQKSEDYGESWLPQVELTSVVEGWRKDWPLTLFAVAPGHGLQMKNGTLVLPLWLSCGINAHNPACFASLYSEDHGDTWKRSNLVLSNENVLDPTEGEVAELSDGSLLATLRHGAPETRLRAFVRGTPEHWGNAYLDPSLPDPICAGSILSLPDQTLLFSNCAWKDEAYLSQYRAGGTLHWSKNARQNLTLRRSMDNGKTWSKGIQLSKQGGYSDLGCSVDGNFLYCFFERGWIGGDCIYNKHLTFAQIKREVF